MNKGLIRLTLVVGLAAALGACGGPDANTPSSSPTPGGTTTTPPVSSPSPKSTPPTSPAPAPKKTP
ncbi:serine protease [Microcoleus sp. LAD1_D5]|uniref:serine protease n=1 Tax=unclassified Microcoleus TaxID=2642155 RepID=UPI002FD0C79E